VLHDFISRNLEQIIRRCRAKVATRLVPSPTEAEMDHGVPVFLDQLADALRDQLISSPDIAKSAVQHGMSCSFKASPCPRSCTTMETSVRPSQSSQWR
jgi:hypothetical protein